MRRQLEQRRGLEGKPRSQCFAGVTFWNPQGTLVCSLSACHHLLLVCSLSPPPCVVTRLPTGALCTRVVNVGLHGAVGMHGLYIVLLSC